MENIKFLKETEFHPHHFLYEATLENGIKILVKDDGSAIGDDGKTYYNISRKSDDGIEILGWSKDINEQIFLEK